MAMTAPTWDAPAVRDGDCGWCSVLELKYLIGIRVVWDLVPLLGVGEALDRVVEHVTVTYAKTLAGEAPPVDWYSFWSDYRSVVDACTDPGAADADYARRLVWSEHAQQLPTVEERAKAAAAKPAAAPLTELPALASEGPEDADPGAVAEARYMMSLVVLPRVSRHLRSLADLDLVVKDITCRAYRSFAPDQQLDADGFVRSYFATVEHGASSLVSAWRAHVAALRQNAVGHPAPVQTIPAHVR